MSAYDELMAYERDTQALAQIAGRLGWDQETMMPRGAAAQGVWAEARENEDFSAFSPTLMQVLDMKREEAAALADGLHLL